MIRYTYPWVFDYLYIVLITLGIVLGYTIYRRRKLLKIINVRDNIWWYLIQLSKIASITLLFISASLPIMVRSVTQTTTGAVDKEEVSTIVANMTALHVLIVDESKSMLYRDETNITRYERALDFVKMYLSSLSPYDQVMIIGFAEYPRKICIGNATQCMLKINDIVAGKKYSSISTAVGYAYTYVSAAQYPAVFVIVSDGAFNAGGDPYEAIRSINSSGYPVLFVRVGFDQRANDLMNRLETSGIKVIYVNQFTQSLIQKLVAEASRELRVEAFITKRLLEIKIVREETDPSPTFILISTSFLLFIASRLEGY